MFQTNAEAPLRGAGTPDKPFGFYDATIDGGWQVPGEPYTSASDDPARKFVWWRARMLGGRTNHWGRISLRNGPYDFKPHTRDGLGFDWPMSYEDLAPYYDKVEMLIGVYGGNDGLENTPNSLARRAAAAAEAARQRPAGRKQRARSSAFRSSPSSRRAHAARSITSGCRKLLHPGNAKAQRILAADMQKRAACFWATPCGRGCSIRANYQSTTVHLPPALATGNLDIVTDAMVREVTQAQGRQRRGRRLHRRKTGAEHRVKARVVVLAASALRVGAHPAELRRRERQRQGRQIHHGHRGRELRRPGAAAREPAAAQRGRRDGGHMYAPWWLYKEQLAGKLGFARGYHIEFGGGRSMPGMGTGAGLEWLNGGSYGRKFKEDARRYYGSFVYFAGRGEMIPERGLATASSIPT